MDKEELNVKSETSTVSYVIGELERFCVKHKIESDITENIAIACDEAVTNIIMHGYEGKDNGDIHVVFHFDESSLTIELNDWGHQFHPPSEISKKPKFKLDQWEVGGFGLILMNEFMDELRFSHDEKQKRNNLIMKKYLE